MEQNRKDNQDTYSIDLTHILRVWLQKLWLIILCAVLLAVAAFSVAKFLIPPEYSSSVMLYVNNSKQENSSGNITSSDINASQSLVKTYGVMLNNRSTLEKVIEETDVPYTYKQVSKMISSQSANSTEVMVVTVTCENAEHAAQIANGIANVLPSRISEIMKGASMSIVDSAVVNPDPVGPSVPKYTLLGFALGLIGCMAVLAVIAALDNTIQDDNYIMENYDYPILARVPDLLEEGNARYNYYKRSSGKSSDQSTNKAKS